MQSRAYLLQGVKSTAFMLVFDASIILFVMFENIALSIIMNLTYSINRCVWRGTIRKKGQVKRASCWNRFVSVCLLFFPDILLIYIFIGNSRGKAL